MDNIHGTSVFINTYLYDNEEFYKEIDTNKWSHGQVKVKHVYNKNSIKKIWCETLTFMLQIDSMKIEQI